MAESEKMQTHREYADEVMRVKENSNLTKLISLVQGVIFAIVMMSTGFIGFGYSVIIAVPLLFISPWAMQFFLSSFVQYSWMTVTSTLLRCVFGCKYQMYGERIRKSDTKILLITNHRTRLDWLLILNMLMNEGRIPGLRFSLKAPLKNVPFIGWFLQLNCHIFLNRNFEADKEHIAQMLQFYNEYNDHLTLVLYPEGTVLWPDTKRKSDQFAEKNNLAKFEHVLQPRVTGLKYLVENAEGIDAIYDITTSYCSHIPQEESAVFVGAMPPMINYVIQRYTMDEVKADPAGWLQRQWIQKEKDLEKISKNKRHFDTEYGCIDSVQSASFTLFKTTGFVLWCWAAGYHLYYFYSFLPYYTIVAAHAFYIFYNYSSFAKWVLKQIYK